MERAAGADCIAHLSSSSFAAYLEKRKEGAQKDGGILLPAQGKNHKICASGVVHRSSSPSVELI
jgi:hypothetical protein